MDQKDVKKRDVMSYDDFIKSYDQARKTVSIKAGQNPHPGAHAIEGEGLYVRNDANPYKAAGIPHNEKEANANDSVKADHVDVAGKPHDGQDSDKDPKVDPQAKKDAKTVADAAETVSESEQFDASAFEKTVKKEEEGAE